jgi:hypothetical protein
MERGVEPSGILNDNTLDNTRNLFASINGRLKLFVNRFPLNHHQRFGFFMEEFIDGYLVDVVTFVRRTVDRFKPQKNVARSSKAGDNLLQLDRNALVYHEESSGILRSLSDVIDDDCPRCVIDQVNDILERVGECVNGV